VQGPAGGHAPANDRMNHVFRGAMVSAPLTLACDISSPLTYNFCIQVDTAESQADGILDIPVHPDNMIWLKLNPQQAASVYEQLGGRNKLGQLILQYHFVEGQDAGDASDFVINVIHNLIMSSTLLHLSYPNHRCAYLLIARFRNWRRADLSDLGPTKCQHQDHRSCQHRQALCPHGWRRGPHHRIGSTFVR